MLDRLTDKRSIVQTSWRTADSSTDGQMVCRDRLTDRLMHRLSGGLRNWLCEWLAISSTGKWEVKVIFHQPLHFLGRITWKPVHLKKCIVPIRNVMKSWPVALYSITLCQSVAGGSYRVIFVPRCTPTRTVRWDVNVSARPSVRPTPPTVRTALVLIRCLRQDEVCRQVYASTGILSVRIMAISVVLFGHLLTVTFNIKWKRGDGQRAISPWNGSLYFARISVTVISVIVIFVIVQCMSVYQSLLSRYRLSSKLAHGSCFVLSCLTVLLCLFH